MEIPFSKYSGCGNDFILIDNRKDVFPRDPTLIQHLCTRRLGIGADGVILLERPTTMRIYNSDGSEAKMCGNGLRCFGAYLQELNIPGPHYTVNVCGVSYTLTVDGTKVSAMMPLPSFKKEKSTLSIDNQTFSYQWIDSGVPHVVIFSQNLQNLNVENVGRTIRYACNFNPEGTNVSFGNQTGDNTLDVRTYERGVEGETLACGTGAMAVAFCAMHTLRMPKTITVTTRSREQLHFTFSETAATMSGPTERIYKGIFSV